MVFGPLAKVAPLLFASLLIARRCPAEVLAAAKAMVIVEADDPELTPDEQSSNVPPRWPQELPPPQVRMTWEDGTSERREWTKITRNAIAQYGNHLLAGASDMENYCPNWNGLVREQRVDVWAFIISQIAYHESGFKVTSRMWEKSMHWDQVTKSHKKYSEGLMQISYDDQVNNPGLCPELNWDVDRNLDPKDPKKTILQPAINLKCAVRFLNRQTSPSTPLGKGSDWAVIRQRNSNSRNSSIGNRTARLAICKRATVTRALESN